MEDDPPHHTTCVKLDTQREQSELFHRTQAKFQHCANKTSEWAWRYDDYCVTSERKANNEIYDELREDTDNLHSNLVQKAIKRAIDAVENGVDLLKQGKNTSQPEFTSWFIDYDCRSATFHDDYVSLATVDGRVECDYVLPENSGGTPHDWYLANDDYSIQSATLQYERETDTFYLHIASALERDEDEAQEACDSDEGAENGTVLGVDLNVTGGFAVTSTGEFIGSADYLNHKRDQYEQRRAAMQQTGTRSAHLTIQSIGSRFARWSDHWLHERANELLDEAERADAAGLVFENLDHIRERISNGKKFQQWAFRAFREIVEYKAKARGLFVDTVGSAYTSQDCAKCGHRDEDNREDKQFECLDCGYEVNADYNAARNIAMRYCEYIHSGQTSQGGWASCQYALKSGMMSVNGDFTASV